MGAGGQHKISKSRKPLLLLICWDKKGRWYDQSPGEGSPVEDEILGGLPRKVGTCEETVTARDAGPEGEKEIALKFPLIIPVLSHY